MISVGPQIASGASDNNNQSVPGFVQPHTIVILTPFSERVV